MSDIDVLAQIYIAAEGDIFCGGHLVGLQAVADYVRRTEYICQCGVRVDPHRCQDGTDF